MFDLLIKGGRLVDGTGNPWVTGDLGIKAGRIAALGRLEKAPAARVIDASELVVSPGFIDIHSHSDTELLVNPRAESKIRQGVTTEVTGNCGFSLAPLGPEGLERVRAELEGYGLELTWETMGGYLAALEQRGIALNVAALLGHGTVRRSVMGYERRRPTTVERQRMQEMVAQAMAEGAFGISTGLIYPPGSFSETEELVELSRVVAEKGGFYASHLRDEGDRLLEAVTEALEIGRRAGIPVELSHHKAVGQANWGKVKDSLRMIDEARAGGLDVTADQYPYVATATGLGSIVPDWAHEGGGKRLLERLQHEDTRRRLAAEVEAVQVRKGGWDKILVPSVKTEKNRRFIGLDLAEIARRRGQVPVEAAFDLLMEEELEVGMIRFGMSEEDVKEVLSHPAVAVGSDGSALAPYGRLGEGKPHPRNYGTFPRVLGKYVREEGVISLEEAVRKMTSLPARRLGLWERGLLRPGFWADITLFEPGAVADRATFADPHQYPAGIPYVLVNGEVVIEKGEHTGALPGRALRH
ncbi:MAG: D-aminoacylase [Firmicutes bacterium]|nr:D-aminoacylase [Bacillota bacterium]MCL5040769.1 D-aminoacylase [Bacillota bacterium]